MLLAVVISDDRPVHGSRTNPGPCESLHVIGLLNWTRKLSCSNIDLKAQLYEQEASEALSHFGSRLARLDRVNSSRQYSTDSTTKCDLDKVLGGIFGFNKRF